jgi:hypothetical protein
MENTCTEKKKSAVTDAYFDSEGALYINGGRVHFCEYSIECLGNDKVATLSVSVLINKPKSLNVGIPSAS